MTAEPESRTLDLSLSQVLAGALAAVSSAVAASYFGVAGTLLGAAVGSVIGTVATAVYRHSLSRTGRKVREIVPIQTIVLRPRSNGDGGLEETRRFAGGTEVPAHPASTTGTTDSSPTDLPEGTSVAAEGSAAPDEAGAPADAKSAGQLPGQPEETSAEEEGTSRGWVRTAVLALAAFALALGVVTVVEIAAGRPLSAWITGTDERGTTFGEVTRPGPAPQQTPVPSPVTVTPSPTATPSVSPPASMPVSPSAAPTSSPGRTGGSPSPTLAPSVPAPTGGSVAPQDAPESS
jgi:hypothetical protein